MIASKVDTGIINDNEIHLRSRTNKLSSISTDSIDVQGMG